MARKIALLIGVSDYGAGLKALKCPENGVDAMRQILSDPDIGGFDEVVVLVNPDVGEMRSRICEVFASLSKQDLVLFYFTGHGIKDMTGDFYLTTAQSELFENGRPNAGTAVEADFLKREISHSSAERKVVILDCCFGAALANGFLAMNADSIDVEAHFGGRGWCLLTASTSARYALEQEGEPLSVYTRYLVEGLKTGGAAPDGQDFISARNLHEYVKAQVQVAAPAMEPAIFNGQQGYDIILAKTVIDNEQHYRKQVQKKIQNGVIGPAGMAVLAQWQQRLGLTLAQAREIENEILQPYRERQQHLAVYTQALEAERGFSYPLNEGAKQNLQELQRLLNLRSEDVQVAERQVLGGRSLPGECKIQLSVWPAGAQVAPAPASQSVISFETVRVDAKGDVTQIIASEASTFEEDLGEGVSLEMVHILGGTFMMGAPKSEEGVSEDEWPQREVTLPSFWMGKYVITRSQWQVVSSIRREEPSPAAEIARLQAPNRPIENVFWTDAVEFCQWLSQHTGRPYQLPSSAQWEYACRAGTTTPFYFGETITPELVNYNGNYAYGQGPRSYYRQQTTDVGSFPPNLFGLYDMHGNVWEWCLDGWHNLHNTLAAGGSAWRLSSQKKFLRGGSWSYLPTNCRSAYSLSYPFHNRIDDIGFRVVCLSPPA
ncbi:MAG: SUMF1/EgtB/PvdO family nonheme iron enzyme [Phormidesmis sp.]